MLNDMLVPNFNDHIHLITEAIYGDLSKKYQDDKYFIDIAIFSPTLDDVHGVNKILIGKLPSEDKIYLSSGSIRKHTDNFEMLAELHTTEILNSIKGFGLPDQ